MYGYLGEVLAETLWSRLYYMAMKELTLNGRTYLTTKRAAEITGYTTDYVGQLARQGKVDAQLVGRNWYIGEDSIKKHKFGEATVSIRKDEDESPAPALELLVSSVEDEIKKEDEIRPVVEEVKEEGVVESTEEDPLTNMQSVWQDWYKEQRSVPSDEEEVFLKREDIISSEAVKDSEEGEEEVSISRKDVVIQQETPVEESVAVEEEKGVEESIPSPLPVKRSWAGTGLALTVAITVLFVGTLTVGMGYVLNKGTDTPVANVYQGVKDYFLGVQRID